MGWLPPEGYTTSGVDQPKCSLVYRREREVSATQLPHLSWLKPYTGSLVGVVVVLALVYPVLVKPFLCLQTKQCIAHSVSTPCKQRKHVAHQKEVARGSCLIPSDGTLVLLLRMRICKGQAGRHDAEVQEGMPGHRRRQRSRTCSDRLIDTPRPRDPMLPGGRVSTSQPSAHCRAMPRWAPGQVSPSAPHSSPCHFQLQ